VPLPGLLGTYKKMIFPHLAEGFDQLWYVRIDGEGKFAVEEWRDEV
jgi:hypothetical protein